MAGNWNKPEVDYECCQYASGPLNGQWVVQRITKEDFAAVPNQNAALALIRTLKLAAKDDRP